MTKFDPNETCPKCGFRLACARVRYSITEGIMRLVCGCGWITERLPLDAVEPGDAPFRF